MANKNIYRGDAYKIRRPVFIYELFDENGDPFPLVSCTVRCTFRSSPVSIDQDPDDTQAAFYGTLTLDGTGTPTLSNKLELVGAAADGTVKLVLTAAETAILDSDTPWRSDIEVTDANDEPFTWVFEDTLTAVDAYTNRTTG